MLVTTLMCQLSLVQMAVLLSALLSGIHLSLKHVGTCLKALAGMTISDAVLLSIMQPEMQESPKRHQPLHCQCVPYVIVDHLVLVAPTMFVHPAVVQISLIVSRLATLAGKFIVPLLPSVACGEAFN